jgi:hypothetical protein
MRLRLLTLAVLVLALAVNAQAATTISLSGGEPQMMLKQEGRSGLSYHIEVGRIEAEGVSTKGGDFTRLAIPGFYTTMIEGAPELPQMNRLIAVPFGAAARVEVSNVVTRTVRLADHGLDAPVMPRQPSLSKSADPAAVPFVHDLAAYAMDKVQPELARVAYQGRMRAMDIARLEIAPVSYRPASGELEIVESMDVTVTFEGGAPKPCCRPPRARSSRRSTPRSTAAPPTPPRPTWCRIRSRWSSSPRRSSRPSCRTSSPGRPSAVST